MLLKTPVTLPLSSSSTLWTWLTSSCWAIGNGAELHAPNRFVALLMAPFGPLKTSIHGVIGSKAVS